MTASDTVVLPTDSYARIGNPRLQTTVHVVGWAGFLGLLVAVIIALPENYQYWVTFYGNASIPTKTALAEMGFTVQAFAVYRFILEIIFALSFYVVGAIIFWRRADDWVANLLALFLVTQGTGVVFLYVGPDPLWRTMSAVMTAFILGSIFLLLCLFPNGKFVPHWIRWLLIPYCPVGALYVYASTTVQPPPMLGNIAYLFMVVFWSVGLICQIRRLRQTTSAMQRQQTKRIITGATVGIVGAGLSRLFLVIATPGPMAALYIVVVQPLFVYGGLLFFLVMAAFSILRYRLWDIDLVINRGLVYGGLTLGLGAVFLVGLVALQSVLNSVLGGQQTTIAAMISAGAVVALFQPVRKRLQKMVDRRLFGLRLDLDEIAAHHKKLNAPIGSLNSTTLGPYEISELMARGGMGEVYRGHHATLGRTVAIKVLSRDRAHNPEFQARFEREARTVAGLRHPNIVSVFDYGESGGTYYMVMEYIEGHPLSDILHERRLLPLEEAIPLVNDIASALGYAHEQGVVHRDVKPSNIMLRQVSSAGSTTPHQQAILTDFGLIKLAGSGSGLTQSGAIGTLAYMAPEQIMSAHQVDNRADIYSLGVMTYQMLTGKLPFASENPAQLVFAHLQQPPPDPRAVCPDLPIHTAKMLMRAMAKDPRERPSTAGAFATALAEL
jgi:hypothetical protein